MQQRWNKARWSAACLIGLCVAARSAPTPDARGPTPVHSIAPITIGDEPIVASEHTIQTARGPMTYEARIGRLPIRSAETGEVRGRIFFVAYVVKPKQGDPSRPLTFAWNGGPGSPSSILHLQGVRTAAHRQGSHGG